MKILFVILLSVLAGCEQQEEVKNLDLRIESGKMYLDQHQFRPAMIEARNVLLIEPGNEEANVLLGKIYQELGQNRKSITLLESINGESQVYFEVLIGAYIKRRKYGSALHLLRQQKSLWREDPDKYDLLTGNAYIGMADFKVAQKSFMRVQERDPSNVAAKLGLVRLLVIEGDFNSAESKISKLLEEFEEEVDALILSGIINIRLGNLIKAEDNLTEAIFAMPAADMFTVQRLQIVRALIAILVRQGRSGEALVYQRMLSDAYPRSHEIDGQFQTALMHIKDGQVGQAAKLLEEILKSAPGNEATGSLLGILKYMGGDFVAADRHFALSVDAEIAPPYVLKYMASNLYKLGQLLRIVRTLEGRIEESKDANLLAIYGISALNSKEVESGIKALKRAINLDPSNPRLSMILAQYYNDLNPPNHYRALEEITSALENNADNVEMQSVYFRQLIRMDRPEVASLFVKSKMAENPNDAHTLLLSGSLNLSEGKLDAALENFSQVISMNPQEINGHFGKAQVFLRQTRWSEARESYLTIIEMVPGDIRGYRGLINSFDADNGSDPGLQELERLAEAGNETARLVVVEYLTINSKLAEAQAYLDVMTAGVIHSPQTRRLTAQVSYLRTLNAVAANNFNNARDAVFKALNAYPTNIRLLTLLAQIEIRTKSFGEAEKVIEQIKGYHPDSNFPNTLSGDLAMARGDYGSAINQYRKSWNQTKDDIVALKLFQAFVGNEDTRNAEAFTSEWETNIPGSILAIIKRAELQTDSHTAIKIYEDRHNRTGPSHVLLNNLAWLYLEEDRLPDAIRAAEQAYTLAPENASVIDTYGWILNKAGEHTRAVEYLQTALKLAPDSKAIKSHLAAVQVLN